MKKIIKYFFITSFTLICALSLIACINEDGGGKDNSKQLSVPIGVSINSSAKTLTWAEVTDASGYSVQIDTNTPVNLTGNSTTSYSLASLTVGTYSIKVKAVGDGIDYIDSEWATAVPYTAVPYTAVPYILTQQLVTPTNVQVDSSAKTLTWAEVTDASGYSVQIDTNTPVNLTGNSTTSYSLASLTAGTYSIKVKAVGDGINYIDSEWATPVSHDIFNKLEVIFDSIGGSIVESVFVNKGDKIGKPDDPIKTGYTFDAWHVSSIDFSNENKWSFVGYSVTENITLYANWTANAYNVSFDANGGSNVPSDVTAIYDLDMPVITSIPTRIGYDFLGFFDSLTEGSGTKYYNDDLSSACTWDKISDTLLYAKWESLGDGTQERPYKINTNKHFITFAEQVNNGEKFSEKYIELQANINLDGIEWIPVGANYTSRFDGIFNGNGYKVSNFMITASQSYAGLFGYNSGTIQNLGVEGFTINIVLSESLYAGGLAGINSGKITNCYASGSINAETTIATPGYNVYVGGLVGYNSNIAMNCHATVAINASSYRNAFAGGLTGHNYWGAIVNCYATGNVNASAKGSYSASSTYVGGLVGRDEGRTNTILNCYATGDMNASAQSTYPGVYSYAGGLVGHTDSTILNSYATGNISAIAPVVIFGGGLIGNGNGMITNSYCYSGQTFFIKQGTAEYSVASNALGTSVSLENLQSEIWIKENLCSTESDIWMSEAGQYPTLDYNYINSAIIEISTVQQLTELQGKCLSLHYKLTADIDLAGIEWIPILNNCGIFNGNGYKVSNFKITTYTLSFSGLFGINYGTIQKLGVEKITVDLSLFGVAFGGGLVGSNVGTIKNCYATGNVSVGVTAAYITSEFSYWSEAGGLVGDNSGIIKNCFAAQGNISATSRYSSVYVYAGGLIGGMGGTIENCYRYVLQTFYRRTALSDPFYTANTMTGEAYAGKFDLQTFYTDELGWDSDIWNFNTPGFSSGKYPKLKH